MKEQVLNQTTNLTTKYLAKILYISIILIVNLAFIFQGVSLSYANQPSPEMVQKLERKMNFDEAIKHVLPLTPEEIIQAKKQQEAIDQAIAPNPAQMLTGTRTIPVTPGQAPQVINLTFGYTSTLLFQDITGRPWPILSLVIGNSAAFDCLQPKVTTQNSTNQENPNDSTKTSPTNPTLTTENVNSHILNIVPKTTRASSNLALTLEDCPYPIILHLLATSPNQSLRQSDALVVLRLTKPGPKAQLPTMGPAFESQIVSDVTLNFIHALPPDGAKPLKTEPTLAGLKLWKYQDQLYLRTNYPLIWPAWIQVANGEDMRVYLLPKTRSIVVSHAGTYHKLRVVGGQD